MLHFIDLADVSSTVTSSNINTFIVPVSADTVKDGKFYQAMRLKYSDFEHKVDTILNGKELKPSSFYKIKLDSGHTVFITVFKAVDKFGAYILDIINSLTGTLDSIKSEYDNLSDCRVLLLIPDSDSIKLAGSLLLPSIIDAVNVKGLNLYFASDGEYANYLESINETMAYYRRDSWKADWMLSLDDIRLVEIIATVIRLSHSFKISKSSLVKCYWICHQNGMFPKLEFYDTEFGKFFKMFLVKTLTLTNHGLLMNTQHYSKADPPRFNGIMGPNYPLLKYLAYTQLKNDSELIVKVAKEIQKDYITSFKAVVETPKPTAFSF